MQLFVDKTKSQNTLKYISAQQARKAARASWRQQRHRSSVTSKSGVGLVSHKHAAGSDKGKTMMPKVNKA